MRLESLKNDKNADSGALAYPQYLLDVEEGNLMTDEDDFIQLPSFVNTVQTSNELNEAVFSQSE